MIVLKEEEDGTTYSTPTSVVGDDGVFNKGDVTQLRSVTFQLKRVQDQRIYAVIHDED